MFEALACGPFAPSSETAWFKGFSHVNDDLAFVQTGNFSNFLKGDAIGPGGPDDPVVAAFGWLGFFDPGDGKFRHFGFHGSLESNLATFWGWANFQPPIFSRSRKKVSIEPLPLISIFLGSENSNSSPSKSRKVRET